MAKTIPRNKVNDELEDLIHEGLERTGETFNDMIVKDLRVESVILPLRDGLNIIHKL